MQARYIGGGTTVFKLPHTAPPIYLNSELKGPLTAGVRIYYSFFMLILSWSPGPFKKRELTYKQHLVNDALKSN